LKSGELGERACSTCIDDLIRYGLRDEDSLTRQYAGSALASCADEVLASKGYANDIKRLLTEIDADGSGEVDFNEFELLVQSHLHRFP